MTSRGENRFRFVVRLLLDWGVGTWSRCRVTVSTDSFRMAKDRLHYPLRGAAALAPAPTPICSRLGVLFRHARTRRHPLLNGLYDARIDSALVLALTGMTYHGGTTRITWRIYTSTTSTRT